MKEETQKPGLVLFAEKLKEAFQSGSDARMMSLINSSGKDLADLLTELIRQGDIRTLTYAAPQIASLADRLGWLTKKNVA